MFVSRRKLLAGAGAALVLPWLQAPASAARQSLTTYRTPGCDCCLGWVRHMEQAGFEVRVVEQPRLDAVQRSAGVPPELAGCHVAMLGQHSFSGHVPVAAVRRFLDAPGDWRGLAVPGMPVGSPGMEMEGQQPQAYDVHAFGRDGRHELFARARGADLV